MKVYPSALVRVGAAAIVVGTALVYGAASLSAQLPLAPPREAGQSITPAYEGWYKNDDGTFSLLVGYYNRNTKQTLDIPVGPNNRIEPGEPDQGQPTHFETGRQWGVFIIKVPKDFAKKAVTWTIVSNGETQSIPLTLNPGYPITPYKELGMGNKPPELMFAPGGAKVTGPPTAVAATFSGKVGEPLPISAWVDDFKAEGTEIGRRGYWPGSTASA